MSEYTPMTLIISPAGTIYQGKGLLEFFLYPLRQVLAILQGREFCRGLIAPDGFLEPIAPFIEPLQQGQSVLWPKLDLGTILLNKPNVSRISGLFISHRVLLAQCTLSTLLVLPVSEPLLAYDSRWPLIRL